MFPPSGFVLMVVGISGLLACSAAKSMRLRLGADYGEEGAKVWVRGPWEAITPSRDLDEVIDQLCPAVERLDRARDGNDGVEYCGLLYSSPDGLKYASAPSPLGLSIHEKTSREKSCRIPLLLRDQRAGTQVLADFHSHPWPENPLSTGDLSSRQQHWSLRIQFDTTCHVYKYVPYADEARPGEIYLRAGSSWRFVGIVRVADKREGRPTPPLEEAR